MFNEMAEVFPYHLFSSTNFHKIDRTVSDAVCVDSGLRLFVILVILALLEYQAQSPDEGALVSAARNFGFVFKVSLKCPFLNFFQPW